MLGAVCEGAETTAPEAPVGSGDEGPGPRGFSSPLAHLARCLPAELPVCSILKPAEKTHPRDSRLMGTAGW